MIRMGSLNPWSMSEGPKIQNNMRLAFIALTLLIGMGIGPSWGEDTEKTLRLSLTTSKAAYTPGEPVKLILTVGNISDHPVILSFESAKKYDFVVSQGGDEIWRWSNGQLFAMVLTHLILAPRDSRRFEAVWLQTDQTSQRVRPGFYEATGNLQLQRHALSDSTSFVIDGPQP